MSSSGRVALAMVVVWLIGSALLMTRGPYAGLDPYRALTPIPEETPGISTAQIMNFLTVIQPRGRALYARAQWFDYVTPLLAGAAGLAVLGWATRRLRLPLAARALLLTLPVMAAVAEIVENALLLAAVRRFPEPAPMAGMIGTVTGAKLALFALTVVMALLLSVWVGARRLRAR